MLPSRKPSTYLLSPATSHLHAGSDPSLQDTGENIDLCNLAWLSQSPCSGRTNSRKSWSHIAGSWETYFELGPLLQMLCGLFDICFNSFSVER
ncbi:hypothetical protein AVEN_156176-1 [Araneus ventricosus]|uniref:Uncharacterized protein n=1 Tax=Araneus ventricosus TaxID=182803 RepID=A0A4Y2PAT0_ARAVE|nr:hypothetical protein AVEN_156176-1 [Araneus ventricosus]